MLAATYVSRHPSAVTPGLVFATEERDGRLDLRHFRRNRAAGMLGVGIRWPELPPHLTQALV
ncbi:MAG: hypothetical protein MUD01_16075 [Chloroflexaceae bacterium]|nr:hypothetical protein [Chloroflexaceae bacterium]